MTPQEMPGRDVTNQAGIAVINSAAAAKLSVILKLYLCTLIAEKLAHKFTGHVYVPDKQFLKVLRSLVRFLP